MTDPEYAPTRKDWLDYAVSILGEDAAFDAARDAEDWPEEDSPAIEITAQGNGCGLPW